MHSVMRRAIVRPKRRFISMPQGDALPVIGGLIGANVGVYAMWQTLPAHTMVQHFTLSRDFARNPHTFFTFMFSHRDGFHLFANMLTLFFFGPEVIYAIGARSFLNLYLGAGVVSGAGELALTSRRNLGASGAVNAAVTWSVLANPWRLIVVFAEFIPIPLPAILYGAVFIGKDVAALFGVRVPYLPDPGNTANGAHVAGAACGAAHFAFFRRPPRRFF